MKRKNPVAFRFFILNIDSLFSRRICFECYFRVERKNRAQVKEITYCISRLKKDMEPSIVKQTKVAPLYQILNISTYDITGNDLANQTDLAANLKADFDKLVFSSNVKCS